MTASKTPDSQALAENAKIRVAVGLSGGVDSAVSALLLKQQGYDVVGVFMKNWDEPNSPYCTSEADAKDVSRVCQKLGIELITLNFVNEYQDLVFSEFLKAYKAGFTPNPDVLCNQEIKFKAFYKECLKIGADKIATGHYSGVSRDGVLVKAADTSKDQTYFLYRSPKEALKNTIFPLSNLTKKEVREIALKNDLHVHEKKDSTGVCFIGERPFREFLANYLKPKSGPIKHFDTHEVLGTHQGVQFYTLGQRRGMGLGGEGKPFFVVKKDLSANTLFVVRGDDHPALYSKRLVASDLSLLEELPLNEPIRLRAKVRYRQPEQDCIAVFTAMEVTQKLNNKTKVEVIFDQPQRAITPGQSLVLYRGDYCIGGGIILESEPHPETDK